MIYGISGKIGSGKDTVATIIQGLHDNYGDQTILSLIKEDKGFHPNHVSIKTKRFADKLKDIVCLLIGCTREQLEDREFKEKPLGQEWWYWKIDHAVKKPHLIPYIGNENYEVGKKETGLVKLTPRKLMQLLGTEAGREILHPNIWCNALFADWEEQHPITPYQKWIIPDTRFPNEAKAIKDRDGILIRVERDRDKRLPELKGKTVSTKELHPSETSLDNYEGFDHIIDNNGSLEDLLTKVKNLVLPL